MSILSWRSRLRFSRTAAYAGIVMCGLGLTVALPTRAQSWSPDGRQIAVGGMPLLIMDAQSAGAAVLVMPPARGAKVMPFLPPLASAATPIAPLPQAAMATAPVWTPDGRTLAYLGDGHALTLYDLVKQQAKVLDPAAIAPIVFSPDSSLFASVHKTESNNLQARIRYRNGQTFLQPIALPFHSVPATYAPLAWLPNTTNVIIAGGDGGKNDLYLLDQGEVVRLTSTGDVLGYGVSGDGLRLRWVRRTPNTHYILLQVYEMNIDTRSLVKLPYPDSIKAVNPNPHNAPDAVLSVIFAPDLNRFAFVTQGGPQAGAGGTALWLSDIAGRNVVFVAKSGTGAAQGAANPVQSGTGGNPAVPTPQAKALPFPALPPAFSPDSRFLAALRDENGKRSLIIAALNGQTKVTPLP